MARPSYRSPARHSLAIDNVVSDYVSDSPAGNTLVSSAALVQSVSSQSLHANEQDSRDIAALREGVFDEDGESEDLFELIDDLSL